MARRRVRVRGVRRRMRGRGIASWLKKAAKSVGKFFKKEVYNPVLKPALQTSRDIVNERIARGLAAVRQGQPGTGRRRMKGGRRRHRKGMRSLRGRRRIPGSYPAGSGLDYRY